MVRIDAFPERVGHQSHATDRVATQRMTRARWIARAAPVQDVSRRSTSRAPAVRPGPGLRSRAQDNQRAETIGTRVARVEAQATRGGERPAGLGACAAWALQAADEPDPFAGFAETLAAGGSSRTASDQAAPLDRPGTAPSLRAAPLRLAHASRRTAASSAEAARCEPDPLPARGPLGDERIPQGIEPVGQEGPVAHLR